MRIIEKSCKHWVQVGFFKRRVPLKHWNSESFGKNNTFYPFSNIGCDPQDLKFSGEDSFLEIGDIGFYLIGSGH